MTVPLLQKKETGNCQKKKDKKKNPYYIPGLLFWLLVVAVAVLIGRK